MSDSLGARVLGQMQELGLAARPEKEDTGDDKSKADPVVEAWKSPSRWSGLGVQAVESDRAGNLPWRPLGQIDLIARPRGPASLPVSTGSANRHPDARVSTGGSGWMNRQNMTHGLSPTQSSRVSSTMVGLLGNSEPSLRGALMQFLYDCQSIQGLGSRLAERPGASPRSFFDDRQSL